jgi:hypothetical protein
MGKGTNQSVFDRLSATDTYASRRLKEKKLTVKDSGRPLYNIQINNEVPEIPPLNSTLSSGSGTSKRSAFSNSTASSGRSSRNFSSSRSFSSQASSRSSVFDRLASQGTKSSMRKHKKSDTYDSKKDKQFQAEHYLRDLKGNTRILSHNLHKDDP